MFRSNVLVIGSLLGCLMSCGHANAQATPRLPGEIVSTMGYDPKTLDPAKVDDQESELIRYLTAGVLVHLNRVTLQIEPALAESWTISGDGKQISFHLRDKLQFSNGATLIASDVVASIQRVLLKATAAPVGDEFVSPEAVVVNAPDQRTITVRLPVRVTGLARIFEEIAIEPGGHPTEGQVTAGPFVVADYRRGQYIRMRRNTYFYAQDAQGRRLPYASGVRLDILSNREQEITLFRRGEYDLIDHLQPDYVAFLEQRAPGSARDMGASLNTEQLWFNQAPGAPIASWEKQWFQTPAFRLAVSKAIHRADLARLAYNGHATPAYSFVSPSNSVWYNKNLHVPQEDLASAKGDLAQAGFRLNGTTLTDARGHAVSFSLLTNTGNAARSRMAVLIQQDLKALGMDVKVVSLDFPALIDRLLHTQNYEACLLGLEDVDSDPNAMMNVWLSSSPNHQWNPSESVPATSWEAEMDALMHQQATALRQDERKKAVDRLQQIVADQQPFIFLVYPNALYAISTRIDGAQPSVLPLGMLWNVEHLRLRGQS